ncbi:hypothetical protein CPT_Mushroom85 [Salmonella phage Mushroom]|uniref:Uncharacterized protein n=2 Tax=Felixounavirus TaxID=1198140 RepID=Q6KGJ9_BPFO1|nr:hypothetical protein FDH40_gp085 [Salmonella phage Mushroom]AAQ14666.1 unknown [Salmonella phage FelixO1]AJF40615.1 hypothetical protein CPT_Mushroom85 [Salmonella phage Mushroom]
MYQFKSGIFLQSESVTEMDMCLSAKQVYKGSSPFGFSKLFYSLSIKIIIMPCYKYSSFRYRRVFLDRAFLQSYTL